MIAEQVRQHMAKLGFRTVDEMVGRVDRIDAAVAASHWKAKGIDLSSILFSRIAPVDDSSESRELTGRLPGAGVFTIVRIRWASFEGSIIQKGTTSAS